jgi:hypothetical protein
VGLAVLLVLVLLALLTSLVFLFTLLLLALLLLALLLLALLFRLLLLFAFLLFLIGHNEFPSSKFWLLSGGRFPQVVSQPPEARGVPALLRVPCGQDSNFDLGRDIAFNRA